MTIPRTTSVFSRSVILAIHSFTLSKAFIFPPMMRLSESNRTQFYKGALVFHPVNYPTKDTRNSNANKPASPPSRNVFTKSTIPPTGSNPVAYRMLAKTNNTITPLIRLTIPVTTLLTVELTSAMMFLLGLVIWKAEATRPRFFGMFFFT